MSSNGVSSDGASANKIPDVVADAVLVPGDGSDMPEGYGGEENVVKGYDFNNGVDFSKLMASYATAGFQATNLGRAIQEVNKMLAWRLSDEPIKESEAEELKDPEVRKNVKCKIFFAYTSTLSHQG